MKNTIQYLAPRLSTVSVAFLHKHINLHETDSLFEITLANEYEFQVGLDYGTMVKKNRDTAPLRIPELKWAMKVYL